MTNSGDVWMTELSYNQRFALAYSPKPAALISCVTSTWVAIRILRDKQKIGKMYHRLAFGMCISSAINSINVFGTSWSIPSDREGYVHAFGTVDTCTVTGFLVQLGFV